jgi:hypothetical protein
MANAEMWINRCHVHTLKDYRQKSAPLCKEQVAFSEAIANCTALRVVRNHLSEQRKQRASNFHSVSNVSFIFIKQ